MFIKALFTIQQPNTWKQLACASTNEWIKKMWYIHTMEQYSARKKNEIMPLAATWMDLESVILSEVCQTDKEIPYNTTYVQNLKYNTNQHIYEMKTDSQMQRTDLLPKSGIAEGRTGSLGLTEIEYYTQDG